MSKKIKHLECRVKQIKEKTWKRSNHFSDHHMTPESRGGETVIENLLRLEINRHNAWHFLFDTLTWIETIKLLETVCQEREITKRRRIESAKIYSKVKNRYEKRPRFDCLQLDYEHYKAWRFLWGDKTVQEVIRLFKRVDTLKQRQAERRALEELQAS